MAKSLEQGRYSTDFHSDCGYYHHLKAEEKQWKIFSKICKGQIRTVMGQGNVMVTDCRRKLSSWRVSRRKLSHELDETKDKAFSCWEQEGKEDGGAGPTPQTDEGREPQCLGLGAP